MKFLWKENDGYSDRCNQDFNIRTPAPPRTTQSIILMIGVPLRFERKQSHLLFSLVVVVFMSSRLDRGHFSAYRLH